MLTCNDNVGTLGRASVVSKVTALCFNGDGRTTVRPYKGLHVLSLHVSL